jgi:hypothetical protein
MEEYYHPIFLSCSISKSIAKSKNIEPVKNRRRERAARINKSASSNHLR